MTEIRLTKDDLVELFKKAGLHQNLEKTTTVDIVVPNYYDSDWKLDNQEFGMKVILIYETNELTDEE